MQWQALRCPGRRDTETTWEVDADAVVARSQLVMEHLHQRRDDANIEAVQTKQKKQYGIKRSISFLQRWQCSLSL